METVYIEPLQNNLEGIVYPRGFYSQNGGRIVLVNASGDGIITGADAKTMVNSGVKLLDAIA